MMSVALLYVSLLILPMCLAEGNDLCSSVTLKGPSDEYGTQPTTGKLPTLNTSHTDFVTIKCQIILRANLSASAQDLNNYNPRLRFYLTADGKVCTLRSQNNSHPCNSDDDTLCAGFNYRHYVYREEDTKTINFTYNVTTIARMNNSLVTCGVFYLGVGNCYTQTAALISIQDGPTCSPSTTTTNATTTAIEPATTTKSTTTTEPATTTESPTTTTTKSPTTAENKTTTTTKASISPQPTAEKIVLNKEEFFPVVVIVVLVGITLLVANGIQLVVIIKRRASTEVQVSATNGIALEHGTKFDRDSESEENTTTIRNNNTA